MISKLHINYFKIWVECPMWLYYWLKHLHNPMYHLKKLAFWQGKWNPKCKKQTKTSCQVGWKYWQIIDLMTTYNIDKLNVTCKINTSLQLRWDLGSQSCMQVILGTRYWFWSHERLTCLPTTHRQGIVLFESFGARPPWLKGDDDSSPWNTKTNPSGNITGNHCTTQSVGIPET